MSFAGVLAGADLRADGLSVVVPEGWHQGRTAYGGFSSSVALAAAKRVGGTDLPTLRSAQVSFVAPLSARITATARLLRVGKNAVWIAAEVGSESGIGLTATFVFMRPVASELALNHAPLPDRLIAVEDARPAISDLAPLFLRHNFEARFALPRAPEKRPELCWWVRLKQADALDPVASLLLTADALPPGVMPMLGARVPASSMGWQVNLLTATPETRGGWWLLRSSGDYAGGGCSSQTMRIWNSAGEPVLSGIQSIAIFG